MKRSTITFDFLQAALRQEGFPTFMHLEKLGLEWADVIYIEQEEKNGLKRDTPKETVFLVNLQEGLCIIPYHCVIKAEEMRLMEKEDVGKLEKAKNYSFNRKYIKAIDYAIRKGKLKIAFEKKMMH